MLVLWILDCDCFKLKNFKEEWSKMKKTGITEYVFFLPNVYLRFKTQQELVCMKSEIISRNDSEHQHLQFTPS